MSLWVWWYMIKANVYHRKKGWTEEDLQNALNQYRINSNTVRSMLVHNNHPPYYITTLPC